MYLWQYFEHAQISVSGYTNTAISCPLNEGANNERYQRQHIFACLGDLYMRLFNGKEVITLLNSQVQFDCFFSFYSIIRLFKKLTDFGSAIYQAANFMLHFITVNVKSQICFITSTCSTQIMVI